MHLEQGLFLSHPFFVAIQRVHRLCTWSLAVLLSVTRDGERRGVARESVRRINWIATSSSEITLAEVGVGVGRVAKRASRGEVCVRGSGEGGRRGRF